MSAPPLPPSPTVQKPSTLASCILLGLILGALGLVGAGGYWVYNTYFSKSKGETLIAQVSPALPPLASPTAPTAKPSPETSLLSKIPASLPLPVTVPVLDPVAPQISPPSTADTTSSNKPLPVLPETKKDSLLPLTPPEVVIAPPSETPTLTPTTTSTPTIPIPTPEVVLEAADHDPIVKEEPVATFAESAPEVISLKADADRRIEESPPEIYTDADKQKVREAIRISKRLSRVATLQFAVGSTQLGSREIERFKKALLTPEAENLLSDPQAVLFAIGYADATGTSQTNRQISQIRAVGVEAVLKFFKIANKCYSVGIGSTSLISQADQSKNRAVEVWIVLP